MQREAKSGSNDRRLLPLTLLLGFFLLLPTAAAGQSTTSGLSLKKTCPGTAAIGDTVTCTLQVENQGASNVTGLTVTNQVPFPGGPISPVSGCASSLGASDGTPGSGPDYTECNVMEVLDQECPGLQIVVIDQAVASGTDEGTGPVMNTATNAVLVSCTPQEIPDPAPVPAASTVGLVLLALGLVGFGASRVNKRG
jgi:uncharacterized repeat protein (TIGR01451 family)